MQDLLQPTPDAIRTHYSGAVLFEMAKASANRELSALRPQGMLKPFKAYRAKDWDFWVERLGLAKTPTDLYMSMARVDLPLLPSDIQGMRRMQAFLHKEWLNLVTGWSWFLDIDVVKSVEDFRRGKDAAIRCTEVARDMKLPAYPVFSGTGWNVRIDDFAFMGDAADAPIAQRELAREVAEVAKVPWSNKKDNDRLRLGLDLWCDNSVYDIRRIYRVPFGVNSKSGLVVTPMTLGEARECDRSWFVLEDYASRWDVRDRLKRVNDDALRAVA